MPPGLFALFDNVEDPEESAFLYYEESLAVIWVHVLKHNGGWFFDDDSMEIEFTIEHLWLFMSMLACSVATGNSCLWMGSDAMSILAAGGITDRHWQYVLFSYCRWLRQRGTSTSAALQSPLDITALSDPPNLDDGHLTRYWTTKQLPVGIGESSARAMLPPLHCSLESNTVYNTAAASWRPPPPLSLPHSNAAASVGGPSGGAGAGEVPGADNNGAGAGAGAGGGARGEDSSSDFSVKDLLTVRRLGGWSPVFKEEAVATLRDLRRRRAKGKSSDAKAPECGADDCEYDCFRLADGTCFAFCSRTCALKAEAEAHDVMVTKCRADDCSFDCRRLSNGKLLDFCSRECALKVNPSFFAGRGPVLEANSPEVARPRCGAWSSKRS